MNKNTNIKSFKQQPHHITNHKSQSLKQIHNNRQPQSVDSKLITKKHLKKKEEQTSEEKVVTFGSCLCIQELKKMASSANASIKKHMNEKQKLIGDLSKCKFYMSNPWIQREPFLVEEVQKRNLQIRFLQRELSNKRKLDLGQPCV